MGDLSGTQRLGVVFSSAFILNLVIIFIRPELFGKLLYIRGI